MIRIFLTVIVLISFSFPVSAESGGGLVIVTSNKSKVTSLNRKELRRVYLGLTVVKNEFKVRPIRNLSNDDLHEAFLQNVMFMSSRTYERQLNIRTIRKGIKPPVEYMTSNNVVKALLGKEESIAYMWKSEADNNPNIRILPTQYVEHAE